MTSPAMARRRYKNGPKQMARIERNLSRRYYSFRIYGASYGLPALIHNGRKPR